ncbi:MAG: hypothetical protein M0005_02070 [Actinomycetota bacterium]|jgi:hypothetical protein|nr:hypothetical protein [Actinomycetota bacterium]
MRNGSIDRCSEGHLYTASVPKSMFLSVHLFAFGQLQRCPVDRRWRVAKRINPNDLTDQQLQEAEQHSF